MQWCSSDRTTLLKNEETVFFKQFFLSATIDTYWLGALAGEGSNPTLGRLLAWVTYPGAGPAYTLSWR